VIDKMQADKKTHLSPEERAQILTFLQGTPAPASRWRAREAGPWKPTSSSD